MKFSGALGSTSGVRRPTGVTGESARARTLGVPGESARARTLGVRGEEHMRQAS